MRRASRSSDYWFLALTFFVCGATSNGLIGQHFIAHAVDHDFTAIAASGALAVMGAFNFIRSDCPTWVVYTIPTEALCVEPQTAPPDALNIGPTIVEPGQPLIAQMTWTWRAIPG